MSSKRRKGEDEPVRRTLEALLAKPARAAVRADGVLHQHAGTITDHLNAGGNARQIHNALRSAGVEYSYTTLCRWIRLKLGRGRFHKPAPPPVPSASVSPPPPDAAPPGGSFFTRKS